RIPDGVDIVRLHHDHPVATILAGIPEQQPCAERVEISDNGLEAVTRRRAPGVDDVSAPACFSKEERHVVPFHRYAGALFPALRNSDKVRSAKRPSQCFYVKPPKVQNQSAVSGLAAPAPRLPARSGIYPSERVRGMCWRWSR